MTDKHTPGPWQVGNFYPLSVFDGDEYRGPVRIADCSQAGLMVSEARANVRLIAAAPALLAALKEMIAHRRRDYLACDVEPYAACVAAIKQARGE